MTKIITTILLLVLFHSFGNGNFILGYGIPGVIGIGYDGTDCKVWEGASRDCSIDERYLMQSLYILSIN